MPARINELIQMRDAVARWNALAPELLRMSRRDGNIQRVISMIPLAAAINLLANFSEDKPTLIFIEGILFAVNIAIFITNILAVERRLRHLNDEIQFMANQQKELTAAIQAMNESSIH